MTAIVCRLYFFVVFRVDDVRTTSTRNIVSSNSMLAIWSQLINLIVCEQFLAWERYNATALFLIELKRLTLREIQNFRLKQSIQRRLACIRRSKHFIRNDTEVKITEILQQFFSNLLLGDSRWKRYNKIYWGRIRIDWRMFQFIWGRY